MDKFSELKAAAMAATPGRIGDRIDGSGSIKYECTGYDGSLVLRTNHKDMEYGFVGDNADADELFFRLCVPDVVLELLAELEAKDKRIDELESVKADAAQVFKEIGNELGCNPDNESIMMAIDELKKRRATPVRLPEAHSTLFRQHIRSDYKSLQAFKADEVIAALREQGFTVEGDEQDD
ncbi:ead/Ea22-like family protein [Serratia marcescens]